MLDPSTQNAVYWSTLFLSKCSTHFCYLYGNYFFEVYSYFTTQILLSYNAHCHSFKAQAFPRKCYCWVGKNRIQQPHWLYKSSILGRRIKKNNKPKHQSFGIWIITRLNSLKDLPLGKSDWNLLQVQQKLSLIDWLISLWLTAC